MASTDMVVHEAPHSGIVRWTPEEIDVIRSTVAPDLTDAEMKLLAYQANRTGLDVLAKQIYGLKLKNRLAIITAIDGFRLIAARTGRYLPGRDSTFTYKDTEQRIPASATAYVQVWSDRDMRWHEVAATAHFREYAKLTDKGQPYGNWLSMPHVMLAKCAEALVIRKSFPAELSGIYSDDEMEQATNAPVTVDVTPERSSGTNGNTVAADLREQFVKQPKSEPATASEPEQETVELAPAFMLTRITEHLAKLGVAKSAMLEEIRQHTGRADASSKNLTLQEADVIDLRLNAVRAITAADPSGDVTDNIRRFLNRDDATVYNLAPDEAEEIIDLLKPDLGGAELDEESGLSVDEAQS